MTSEFELLFEGCHESLSAKFKVKYIFLSEIDCHSTDLLFNEELHELLFKEELHGCTHFEKLLKCIQISKMSQANIKDMILNILAASKS